MTMSSFWFSLGTCSYSVLPGFVPLGVKVMGSTVRSAFIAPRVFRCALVEESFVSNLFLYI